MTSPDLETLIRTARGTHDPKTLSAVVVGLRAAMLAQPDHLPAFQGLSEALRRLGRVAEAEAVLTAAIERHPVDARLRLIHARVLADWDRLDDAAEAAEAAIAMHAGDPEALTLLASIRLEQGRQPDAVAALERAVTLRPYTPALTMLGRLKRLSGDMDGALSALEQAVANAGRHDRRAQADARVQRAIAYLCAGRIADGFREYDWRWKTGALSNLNPGLPPWTGEPLEGRTLLIRAEQGLSECLQFFRLAGLIDGGRVVFEAPPELVPILRASHLVSDVVAQGEPLPSADCWAPLLSVPRILKIDADSIPDEVPYLRSDPSLLAPWRERLGPGPKIGIAWHGGEPLFEGRTRRIPLSAFAPLARVEGVSLVSLQKGAGREEADQVPFPVYDMTDDMDEGAGAFLDTAAIMQNCALIVTADTAIAHLAGALARPCWTVLPEGGDWRFGWHASDSPWYPTMECLRRPPGGDWRDVFDHIARRVAAIRAGQTSAFDDMDGSGRGPSDAEQSAPGADSDKLT